MSQRTGRVPHLLTACLVLLMLPTATASHWEEETPTVLLESEAGDPRYQKDLEPCLEQLDDATSSVCTAFYAYLFKMWFHQTHAINLVRPADCLEDLDETRWPVSGGIPGENTGRIRFVKESVSHYARFSCGDDHIRSSTSTMSIRDDVRLDPEVNITGFWTFSADTFDLSLIGLGPGEHPLPSTGVVPCLTVEMTLQVGRDDPVPIAHGSTTKTIVTPAGDDPPGPPPEDPCPGAHGTIAPKEHTQFIVDLGPPQHDLKAHSHLEWVVKWHQWRSDDPEHVVVTEGPWNLHTGPEHLPRIVFATPDTTELLGVWPQIFDGPRFQDDAVYLSTLIASPWSMYDVDLGNIRLTLHDEHGDRVPLDHLDDWRRNRDPIWDHALLTNGTFRWDLQNESLAPGDYTLQIAVPNWQHTADTTWTAQVRVTEQGITIDDGKGSVLSLPYEEEDETSLLPGTPFPLLLLAVWTLLAIPHRLEARSSHGPWSHHIPHTDHK